MRTCSKTDGHESKRARASALALLLSLFVAQVNAMKTVPMKATTTLLELQAVAAPIACAFVPGTFNPLITNCHVQTIGGYTLRDACAYSPPDKQKAGQRFLYAVKEKMATEKKETTATGFWDTRERIETPDGDWFHADSKFVLSNSSSTAPTVILLHGLQSSSESIVSRQMAQAFVDKGMNCVCLNFRGCSGQPNSKLGAYHLGFTDDLHHYLNLVKERHMGQQQPPLYLSGYSLGANVVLKCLGELAERAVTDYNIAGASVLSPPLNQTSNALALAQPGINRIVYTNNLLRTMKETARIQLDMFCDWNPDTDAFDYRRGVAATTITEFDDAFVARIYGFEDCWDYYKKTSSIHYLEQIAVSTFLLSAQDDPFFDPSVWPVESSREFGGPAPLKMMRTPHGGHLGFCFHQVQDSNDPLLHHDAGRWNGKSPPFWGAMEIARFLDHVHSSRA